jgi:hypothetical protein
MLARALWFHKQKLSLPSLAWYGTLHFVNVNCPEAQSLTWT